MDWGVGVHGPGNSLQLTLYPEGEKGDKRGLRKGDSRVKQGKMKDLD